MKYVATFLVNQVKAVELLLLMQSHLKHLADSTTCNSTEEVRKVLAVNVLTL